MSIARLFLFATCTPLLLTASLLAQDSAFNAAPAPSDPFSPKAKVDPFGTQAATLRAVPPRNSGKSASKSANNSKPQDSHTNESLRATLNDQTHFSFIEMPLQDVAQQISELHDIPVIVDRRSLEEIGLSGEEPITLALTRVPLRSALRLLLRELDLTYLIADDVMQITTVERAEQSLGVKFYKLSDMLAERADEIVEAMQRTLHTDCWESAGGPCAAALVGPVVVVSGTEMLHEDVAAFLEELAAAYE